MNRNSVIIKSNPYGLILILDPDVPFEELLQDVGEKFKEGARFFKNAQMALTFRGRVLTRAQERQLVYEINKNSKIHIVCLVDEQKEEEEFYKNAVTRAIEMNEEDSGQFYRGTLRNGQVLEFRQKHCDTGGCKPRRSGDFQGQCRDPRMLYGHGLCRSFRKQLLFCRSSDHEAETGSDCGQGSKKRDYKAD